MEKRRRLVNTICGETESGKTYLFKHIADNYTDGMVTYFDYQGEPSLHEVSEITSLDQLKGQRSGKYRFSSADYQGFVNTMLEVYRDKKNPAKGLIIMDDCSSWMPQNEWKPIQSLMTSVRHMNLDIILVFHYLWRIPPYIIDGSNAMTIFRTGEALEKGNIDRFRHGARIMEAHAQVEMSKEKHHHQQVFLHGVLEE